MLMRVSTPVGWAGLPMARILDVTIGLTLRQPKALGHPLHGLADRVSLREHRVGDVEALGLLGVYGLDHG